MLIDVSGLYGGRRPEKVKLQQLRTMAPEVVCESEVNLEIWREIIFKFMPLVLCVLKQKIEASIWWINCKKRKRAALFLALQTLFLLIGRLFS